MCKFLLIHTVVAFWENSVYKSHSKNIFCLYITQKVQAHVIINRLSPLLLENCMGCRKVLVLQGYVLCCKNSIVTALCVCVCVCVTHSHCDK